MITLISTPEYPEPTDPTVISRWLATESPNNFRLFRQDWIVGTPVNNGGFLQVTATTQYTGGLTNSIAIYDAFSGVMLTGTITNIAPGLVDLTTDIPYAATINPTYLNDNTLHAGYYFEGRLTINNVLYSLTIIASPDSLGYADLDVSGILRIVTSLGKTGDYTQRIMKEPTKSGMFNFEYRDVDYANLNNDWEGVAITSPPASPPILIDWYYAEAVRSEEQGSNLHDYVANSVNDAPFLNAFEQPVYFLGLPFDLSFILPETPAVSPATDITVTLRIYNSNNLLLSTVVELIPAGSLEGFVNSLNIDETTIPAGADHMTAEITTP